MPDQPRPRRPALGALLSFAFPGLGQAYAGRPWLAVLLAVPVLLLMGAAVAVGLFYVDETDNLLLSSTFLGGALLLDAALMAWRLFAIGQVGFARPALPAVAVEPAAPGGAPTLAGLPRTPTPLPGLPRTSRARRAVTIGFVLLLMAATVATHAWVGLLVSQIDGALGEVFSGAIHADPARGSSGPLNEPAYHWDGTDRINILLLGSDSGPGRDQALTDTILAVSVDPVQRTAVMISVPRDTGFVPLPDRSVYADGLYPHKINGLSTEAAQRPELWCPDLPASEGAECGLRTLERAIGLYLGIPIQYYAQVDLLGFTQMIDAVGGVTLCLPGPMIDDTYGGPGWAQPGIELPAGCSRYDGTQALAYARIRKGYIEMPDGTLDYQNDFKRAERQQQVLLELRREFAKLDLLFELPPVLEAVGGTVSTDFPRDRAGDLASLLPLITGPDIERVVLGYPEFVDAPTDPDLNYLLIPRREDVRVGMERLFGAGNLEGWYVGGDADVPGE